jgi:hypothetical protein
MALGRKIWKLIFFNEVYGELIYQSTHQSVMYLKIYSSAPVKDNEKILS